MELSDTVKPKSAEPGKPMSSKRAAREALNKEFMKQRKNGRWTREEHRRFVEGCGLYGKDWRKISRHVGTRSNIQCRTHAQKVGSEDVLDTSSDASNSPPPSLHASSEETTPNFSLLTASLLQVPAAPSPPAMLLPSRFISPGISSLSGLLSTPPVLPNLLASPHTPNFLMSDFSTHARLAPAIAHPQSSYAPRMNGYLPCLIPPPSFFRHRPQSF